MKRLPIAKAVFHKIIEGDFCYVDKTPYIKQMLDKGITYWFLSRPRRFGKSLFVDTLKTAFAGEKELFKGLYLEQNWDWSKNHPIIKIDFGGGTMEDKNMLFDSFDYMLRSTAEDYGLSLSEKLITDRFKELIKKLYEKFELGVVILIDEYDKPLLDNITKDVAISLRDGLSSIYSVLKITEDYLKFVFITGVSKFSKTSLFSKLNNLTDLSLDSDYADICGYTQGDLETIFADYLHNVDLNEVKLWYNGYNFLGSNLYNPYDILLFLNKKKYHPYWFETGTPSFLLELIKERKFYLPKIDDIKITASQMGEFDIDKIELDVLLFQTGYLTIKKTREMGHETIYYLAPPNMEVRKGLNDYLLRMFYAWGANSYERTELYQQIYFALTDCKPEDLEPAFKTFFSGIPFDWYRKNNIAEFEGFYSSMFYAFFAALGFDMTAEDTTSRGRIDLTVKTEKAVFIFEFKMKTNPGNALQQVKDKKYHEKYVKENKPIYLLGIEFDESERNISAFECESFGVK